ncbi:MAG: glycoside hydrolase family 43 protein [Actinomycetota bacterium]|nr:glycoside hydrolase family 43 protein [Actinomycetota bacterium]
MIAGARGEDHGDPFIIKYLDSFYLYHTGETSGRRGVSVHRSTDLVNWQREGFALEAAASGWAWSDLWAPEIVYENGTFYMYVSATRRRSPTAGGRWDRGRGDDSGRRLGLARSETPLGPFRWDEQPIVDAWSIDGHPFRDDDGSMWLFYNVRTDETRVGDARGTGTVVDRLLAPDRVAGEPTPVTVPDQAWEGPYGDWYWNEAPYVLKRRGVYYQLYSGGFYRDSSYAIGVATALAPRGPWTKDPENPIFRGTGAILGTGHNSFIYGPDVATRYAVYHGYVAGDDGRKVNIDRLYWVGDRPQIAGPTETPQPVPPGAVYDPEVPHWRAEAWVRGTWVQVGGRRFRLGRRDAWHQVEAIQADRRVAVRIDGVLRASHPGDVTGSDPFIVCDGDLTAKTVSSFLEDGGLHGLPAGSEYAWRWGGAGRLELSLAVRGQAELALNGSTHRIESVDDGRFSLVHLEGEGDIEEVVVHAGDEGVTIADLFVYQRR